jgi:hypothetical protein
MSSKTETKYKKTYILEGGYHVILEWLNNDCKEPVEALFLYLDVVPLITPSNTILRLPFSSICSILHVNPAKET